jgi:hypothetical protein
MLLYRAKAVNFFTVSCRRVHPFEVFVASSADVTYLVGLVEPLTPEAQTALGQVPAPKESIGWAYPGKGGGGANGRSSAFMWSGERG